MLRERIYTALVKTVTSKVSPTQLKFYKGPKQVLLIYEQTPQSELTKYMPPLGRIWRNHRTYAWNSRYATCPVRACGDHGSGGEHFSILICLQHTWKWFLMCESLHEKNCPIKGLFALTVNNCRVLDFARWIQFSL